MLANMLELIKKLNIFFNLVDGDLKFSKRKHTYHIVDRSPYPFRLAFTLMFMLLGFVFYMSALFFGGYV